MLGAKVDVVLRPTPNSLATLRDSLCQVCGVAFMDRDSAWLAFGKQVQRVIPCATCIAS